MAFRWVVNAGLVIIPLGATLGTLFGIDAQRAANGQSPLFTPTPTAGSGGSSGGSGGSGDSTGGAGGGSGSTVSNGTINTEYCQLSYGITPPAKGANYTLNPNQWGVTDGISGLCINVTTFDNETYPTNISAPQWSATWKYAPRASEDVHAFPNIGVNDDLPILLSDLTAIQFDVAWAYNVGNSTATTTNMTSIDAASLNTNVAIDMFMDSNATTAANSTTATYEVMVWFAHFGAASQVIGNVTDGGAGVLKTYDLNGTNFDLFYGTNTQGQNVFAWVTQDTVEKFTGDLSELISQLTAETGSTYPSTSDYLGYFSFGSEAYYSDDWVTFYVPELSVDIKT